jgi:hypothetical protein
MLRGKISYNNVACLQIIRQTVEDKQSTELKFDGKTQPFHTGSLPAQLKTNRITFG